MFKSAKLDRLVVGSILKQRMVFLISARANEADRPSTVTYLVGGTAEDSITTPSVSGH